MSFRTVWMVFWENEERLSHRQGEARFGQE